MSFKRYLVTSALPYSNGRPHVGHLAGAYLPADIYVRFLKLCGENVRYVCGSDDHGVATALEALKENKKPKEIALSFNKLQLQDFNALNINFDIYSSTCDNPYHYQESQDFFLELYNKGYFKKKTSEQFFDEAKQIFLPDRFVIGTCVTCGAENQKGDQCDVCSTVFDTSNIKNVISVISNQPASIKKTTHWFLDLSRFTDDVENWLKQAELRAQTKAYVSSLLKNGLVERAMTRDLTWGVPVPLDEDEAKNKVLYVWFDAPIGYISNTKELCKQLDGSADNYKTWWADKDTKIVHFIGEDNSIFHCVIWIAMLSAHDKLKLPNAVVVNHFLNVQNPGEEVAKISKSKGNGVWLHDYIEQGNNPDILRYYLTAIAPEKSKGVYRPDELIQKNNSDLANTLGNLVHRVSTFSQKYYGNSIPTWSNQKLSEKDQELLNNIKTTDIKVKELIYDYQFKAALEAIMDLARASNKYLDELAPWTSRKTDETRTKLTLAIAFQAIKFLAVALSPFIPSSANKIASTLGFEIKNWKQAIEPISENTSFGEINVLFNKLNS